MECYQLKHCYSTEKKMKQQSKRFVLESKLQSCLRMDNLRLSEEGILISGPSTSGQADLPEENSFNAEEEKSLLADDSDADLESRQCSPNRKCRQEQQQRVRSKRSRYDDSAKTLESEINKSKESIDKLKAHAEKKTCPKSLCYNVRANITPYDDF